MNGEDADQKIANVNMLRKLYPLPTGLLIGTGIIGLFLSMTYDVTKLQAIVLFFSALMIIGWLLAFIAPNSSSKAITLKMFGFSLVILAFLYILSTFWSPDPNFEGPWQSNDSLCLAFIFTILAVPICLTAFWMGVILDCVSTYRRGKFYLLALLPIIIVYGLLLISVIGLSVGFSFLASPIALGIICIFMGIGLYIEKLARKKHDELDKKRSQDQNERELLEILHQRGFKG